MSESFDNSGFKEVIAEGEKQIVRNQADKEVLKEAEHEFRRLADECKNA